MVLYNLLTNRQPFEADNLAALVQQVATRDPPRLSQCTPASIPPALDQLIARCLARDPDQRPAGVSEMLAVLDGDLGVPALDVRSSPRVVEDPKSPARAPRGVACGSRHRYRTLTRWRSSRKKT